MAVNSHTEAPLIYSDSFVLNLENEHMSGDTALHVLTLQCVIHKIKNYLPYIIIYFYEG